MLITTRITSLLLFTWIFVVCFTAGVPMPDVDMTRKSNNSDLDVMMSDGFGNSRKGFNSKFTLGDNPDPPASDEQTRHHHGGGRRVKMSCKPTPDGTLKRWMGPAFNARYMSVNQPRNHAPVAVGGSPMDWGLSDQAGDSAEDIEGEKFAWGLSDLPSDPLAPDYEESPQNEEGKKSGYTDDSYDYMGDQPDMDDNESEPEEEQDAFHDVERGEFAVDKHFQRDLPEDTQNKDTTVDSESWLKKDNQGSLVPFLHRQKRAAGKMKLSSLLKKSPTKKSSSSSALRSKKKSSSFSTGLVAKKPKKEEWKCDQRVVWTDLGGDHFPRYVRSVVCSQSRCWFGNYGCREKSFTIKVLRRLSDECKPVYAKGAGEGSDPVAYHQEWVFEERALPFCCECGRLDI